MLVRMELARILIRELNDFQMIELREVRGPAGGAAGSAAGGAVDGGGPSGLGGVDPSNGEPDAPLRSFPIVIGLAEAQAIERRLKGVPIKRPQTHDLLASLLDALGATLESITINDLNEHTYYALLRIRRADGEVVEVDARPSDAIALGIATRVPIWVDDGVIEAASDEP